MPLEGRGTGSGALRASATATSTASFLRMARSGTTGARCSSVVDETLPDRLKRYVQFEDQYYNERD
eukprot:10781044-Alexandrium_andersonii.AAC.1